MIRLIAMDLDGTLLNARNELSERTIAALRDAMNAGAMVSLASGRMTESMCIYADKIGVNAPMITYNGAQIYDSRAARVLDANVIPMDVARSVAKRIEAMGIYIQAYPGKGYFCDQKVEYTYQYERSVCVDATALGRPVSEWMHSDMLKMLAIAPHEVIAEAQIAMQEAYPSGVNFMTSNPIYLEIVAQGIDKGRSLEKLAGMLSVQPNEMLAFGDGQNDISMLQYAGFGYAMENAPAPVRASTALVAPSNVDDGVAQVIECYLSEGRFERNDTI